MGKNNYYKLFRKKRKQIVILLGAGAVIPWKGATTKDLNDLITTDTKFKTKSDENLGKYLYDVINSFYGHECANFETIIAAVELILNHTISSTNSGGINTSNTSFSPSILDIIPTIKSEIFDVDYDKEDKDERVNLRVYIYSIFRHFINLIINKIAKYNSQVNEPEFSTLNNNLIKFTEFFLSRGYSVKYYTTNYDNVIPEILKKKYHVYEGLINSKVLHYHRFNYNLERFRHAQLSHFNIHGSIFLSRNFTGLTYEDFYFNFCQELSSNGYDAASGNPNERLTYSPIITGYNKTQRAANKPFNLGYQAFANDCNDCQALITVGYSYGDPQINSILASFTSWDKAKYLIVDKLEGDFNRSALGIRFDHEVKTFYCENENDYWYNSKGNRFFVYKKGFEDFISDKMNWINIIS
jgi:hypothetical protein